MNIVPCITWVKKGVAATHPEKVELTPKELEQIIKQTQSKLQDADSDEDQNENVERRNETQSQIDEYDFDKYDEESGDIHCNISNIATFGKDGKDPLITGNDDDSEKEDDGIKSDDNLVLIGHVEGDASILEIFVYNEAEGSFYCHHDILLPSFPLCIEWLNFDPADSKPSNLCAIGNMTPIIEVWDLDLIDCLEPAYKLGRKPSKKKNFKRIGHKDAVLDLAWNQNFTHVLASGSVDQTVLLWDLENGTPVNKIDSFNEKIQSLKWHPTETHQLLTGCADKMVRLFDCRDQSVMKSWETSGEVEKVLWNQFDPNYCLAGIDNGYMQYFDIRQDEPIWNVEAHTKEVTGLTLSSSCPGLLVTSANDGVIKVWDVINHAEPCSIWEKKTNLGALLCLASNPNDPLVFSAGGDHKSHNLRVFNFSEVAEIRERFGDRISESNNQEEVMNVTENMESMLLNNIGKKEKR
ncbi:PREDICTED: periodic tryptophan protein 1 homolog [Dufourea novaeangliae]|uniref:periodic tryptophan protein 1 homolog n=1 Tax=Dufourea novaeangliae TaxID=178035 RepID=UPI000766E1F2|nr:PREDICTED: periodic tryptophan protein 1 homolog [Dufourea novaeangliae]